MMMGLWAQAVRMRQSGISFFIPSLHMFDCVPKAVRDFVECLFHWASICDTQGVVADYLKPDPSGIYPGLGEPKG